MVNAPSRRFERIDVTTRRQADASTQDRIGWYEINQVPAESRPA
jgi:hypothetical protein